MELLEVRLLTEGNTGIDDDLALRIIGYATRSIAPCLDTLPPGRDFDTVVAILRSVGKAAAASGRIKSQQIGSARVEYFDVQSSFSADDRATLRGICAAHATEVPAVGPVGSFPASGLGAIWPESEIY